MFPAQAGTFTWIMSYELGVLYRSRIVEVIIEAEARMDIPAAVSGALASLARWYNDIEEEFNLSSWTQYGTIGEYRCSQDELEHALQNLLRLIETGEGFRYMGPPIPFDVKYPV